MNFLNVDKKNSLTVRTDWDKANTTFLTQKLYGHVEKGDIEFSAKVKRGSIILEIEITLLGAELSFFASLLANYIWDKMKKQRDRGIELRPVTMIINNNTYIIYGKRKDELP